MFKSFTKNNLQSATIYGDYKVQGIPHLCFSQGENTISALALTFNTTLNKRRGGIEANRLTLDAGKSGLCCGLVPFVPQNSFSKTRKLSEN